MQRHAGWLAAELAVPGSSRRYVCHHVGAWLVGLEAACCHAGTRLVGGLAATSEWARGSETLVGVGLTVALQMSPARVLPGSRGRPRQESCRGSSSSGSYLVLQAFGLHKDLHTTM